MTYQALKQLIIATQLISLAATAAILLFGLQLDVPQSVLENWSGTFSTVLLLCGALCHMQARKGMPPAGLVALLCVFGPAYAFLGGIPRHLIGFHAFALGFHAFILWHINKRLKAAEAGADE